MVQTDQSLLLMVVTLYGSEGSAIIIDGLLHFMVQRDQSLLLMVVTLYGSERSVIIIDGCYTLWFRGISLSF